MDKKCLNCSEYKRCKDSGISWIFFIIGIISTIAVRIVMVLAHLNPIYGKLAWYVGVTGFFMFFLYKYKVGISRTRVIEKNNLVEKISKKDLLTHNDYELVSSILCSLGSKKEQINYFLIFGLSAVALLTAVYIDFF
ncbi:MAG: hypothetical protein JW983_04895 [Elusimicrobia bacterium]|nr:hypothetical protein [Elusimicrobiota bacterium]